MKTGLGFLILCLLACSGCSTANAAAEKPTLDGAAAAASIILCSTTLDALETRLGKPTRDGLVHRDHIVSWITEWDPLPRYLAVLVNGQGVVTDVYWNAPTEIPWTPADQCTKH